MNRHAYVTVFMAAILCLLDAPPTQGGFIIAVTADVEPQGGQYSYDYQLSVSAASTLSATDFLLSVAPAANLQSIVVPAGWGISYSTGDSLFYAYSPDSTTDIDPGQTQHISFLSPLAPDSQSYQIFGFNSDTSDFDTATDVIAGPTVQSTPSAVPEPASFVLVGIGVAGMAGYGWRRRKATAA